MSERTTTSDAAVARPDSGRRPDSVRRTDGSDLLAALASDLDLATRATVRLRSDGLLEVVIAGAVVGFVDHVAPVFVALAGSRPAVAIEVAQHRTLAQAVEALRARA